MIVLTWSDFDRIDHEAFEALFSDFGHGWNRTPEIAALPAHLTFFRGQSTDAEPGLSWTLDRKVAEGFARGHRNICVPDPVILTTEIERADVAMYLDARNEREVVLFKQPWSEDCEVEIFGGQPEVRP